MTLIGRLAVALRARVKLPLALGALCLVGLQPFTHTSLASSFDGLLHLHRLVEIDHLLAQGIVYPRWAPDFVFGFGFPIFNFYAPLAYYLAAALHRLGIALADTATVFFVLCSLAAAWAMYRLVRELAAVDDGPVALGPVRQERPYESSSLGDTGRHAALVAAAAYVYAPTHIYDNFYRSAWGTVLAYAIAPWLLSEMIVLYRTGRTRTLVSIALGTAALMLAHNITALLTVPLVAAGVLAFLPLRRGGAALRPAAMSTLAIGAGLGMSAFFWLPALVETQYVQTWRLTIPPDFDFRNHFLSIANWFAWSAPAEVGRINPDLVNSLGPVQAALAAAGVALVVVRGVQGARNRFRDSGAGKMVPATDREDAWRKETFPRHGMPLAPGIVFALGLGVSLALTLPISLPVWESVPLLPSLQFPHRFLTAAALYAAVLGAAGIAALPKRWQARTAPLIVVLLVVSAIPLLYPRPQGAPNANPGLGEVLEHERRTGALGTTASGEYFPVWVKFIPRSSPFEEAIVNGENPQRFESRSLPPGGKVLSQTAEPYVFALSLTSPQEFTATFRHFYFPGWQGYVDKVAVATVPSEGQGFSTFRVPAGEHRIELRFESTAVRDVAVGTSLLTLITGGGWLTIAGRRRGLAGQSKQASDPDPRIDDLPSLGVYITLGLACLLFKIGIVDNIDTPLRTSFDGLHAPGLQYPQPVGLGGMISYLGYSLPRSEVAQGDTLELTLYWAAQRNVAEVYSSFAQVVDLGSNLYAQKDNLHPGGAPTTTWRPNEYDVDRHPIVVPAGTPPGEYQIAVGLYRPADGVRLLRDRNAAEQPPDQILIGPVRVRRSDAPMPLSAYGIRQPLEHALDGIRLLGLTIDKERLPADDFLRVALFWRAERSPLPARRMSLRILDATGRPVAEHAGAPSNDRYPTTQWSAGEIVRDNRALWIPRTLAAGDYRLSLMVEGAAEPLDLGSIRKP